MASGPANRVVMGRVIGAHGVHGAIRVRPFTENLDNLFEFPTWWLQAATPGDGAAAPADAVCFEVIDGHVHGQSLIAELAGLENRDQALAWVGKDVAVDRGELPEADEGEFYWTDLVGCAVVNRRGEPLGVVAGLLDTGAHAVLRVNAGGAAEHLIPFVSAIVGEVDLAGRTIEVDWESDY
jgi:16S rRNA processing protein RimM